MTAYGIDFGTTHSCIARLGADGEPEVIKNARDELLTPSVVFFDAERSEKVGRMAKSAAELYPNQVVPLIKRHLADPDWARDFYGESYSPTRIAAVILTQLASAASARTQERVHDVVITVPAYFQMAQKTALRQAGEIAGLNVLGLIPEPVAAALHYHYHQRDEAAGTRHVLVYDLGGGTFDATVIRLAGDEIRVICVDGDHHLGGADWDKRIAETVLEDFRSQFPDVDPAGDRAGMAHLTGAVEQARELLSADGQLSCEVSVILEHRPMKVELSRAKLESRTQDLLDRTLAATERTIATAKKLGATPIDEVVLVGGMTKMPAVQGAVAHLLGRPPTLFEPDLAVVKGAAIYAAVRHIKKVSGPEEADREDLELPGASGGAPEDLGLPAEQAQRLERAEIIVPLTKALGLSVYDDSDPMFSIDKKKARSKIVHLIPANVPLPQSATVPFQTAFADQRSVLLEVWEQAGSSPSEKQDRNHYVGEGRLAGLPPGPAGRPFEVTFTVDTEFRLEVYAHEQESGREVRFPIRLAGLTDEQVKDERKQHKRHSIGD